jgi:hypothetical protein
MVRFQASASTLHVDEQCPAMKRQGTEGEGRMQLEAIANGTLPVSFNTIGGDPELTRQVQERLTAIGLLEPPADGVFGPVSIWGLSTFLREAEHNQVAVLTPGAAAALLSDEALRLFPLRQAPDFAGRIASLMQAQGRWICRHPDCINIVYIEGIDPHGKANNDSPNVFNDLRIVFRIEAGAAVIVERWDATTEPGRYYTEVKKLNPDGAARIAFGQYKAWSVGTHMNGRPSAHEALVQTASVKIYRDLNEDYEREGDKTFIGLFGINQHWGFDMSKSDIGAASAGCLVGRTTAGHRAFMNLCKADPRYQANNSYRFATAVLPASGLAATP